MLRLIIPILLIFFIACTNHTKKNSVLFEYSDFGPQVIASEIIGKEWWQWQSHGESRPIEYNIKVVVYRDISLEKVKAFYPVNPGKNKDYRYVEYQKTLNFLEEKIQENVIGKVTHKLKVTKTKLVNQFNGFK